MRDLTALLADLSDRGIELWIEGERLRFRAPQGAMTADLREQLGAHKDSVMSSLRERAQADTSQLPLSYNQEALWFLNRSAPESAAYNVGVALRIRSQVDVSAMRNALQALVDRHPTLRTVYYAAASGPRQLIRGREDVAFTVEDASALDARELQARVQELYARPFDLARGPVFRPCLLTTSASDHVLLLTVHHIAADGWSTWLLLDELRALYRANVERTVAGLPKLDVDYGAFVRSQRELVDGERGRALVEYWSRRLEGGDLPVLDLPADRRRPAVQRYEGATLGFSIDESRAARLKELARTEGTTLFVVVLALFQALLQRWTGQEDVLVGTPTFGRTVTAFQGIVGDFVNTVVLRGDLSGGVSFRGLIARLREVVLEAVAHEDLPFSVLVQRLGISRDPSRPPLVQSMFVLQKPQRSADIAQLFAPEGPEGRASIDFGGLTVEGFPLHQQEGQLDLTLEVAEAAGALLANLKYNTEVFETATIERLRTSMLILLDSALEAPDTPVGTLRMISAEEQRLQVAGWNQHDVSFPVDGCLHELFERQAERTPDAIAASDESEQWSYRSLNERANRLAHHLRDLGVSRGDLVAVCAERSLDLVAGLLAILKAGAGYLPIDPSYPAERRKFMLEDGRVRVVLTDEAEARHDWGTAVRAVRLDDPAAWNEARTTNPAAAASVDDIAYVIYTSGSTGQPKGVLVTHRNVVRLMRATEAWFRFTADDVWTLFHSYAFDFSVWEIWGALLYGGRLAVVPYWVSRSPEAFRDLLARERVTVLNQTPSAFRQLVRADGGADAGSSLALRYVIFGGEALEPASLKPWVDRHGDERPQLINMYGITETTVHVTYRRITRREVDEGAGSLIGVPIPDLQVYVFESPGQLAPIGVAGEMYVGGAGVARGYLNRPELTEARFVPDPFSASPGARLYRSGDLARRLPSGDLEYLGRIDQQVKIRGFRIELGEIESALVSVPGIQEAAVVTDTSARGDVRLVAAVVPKSPDAFDEGRARAAIRERLPEYMVPAVIIPLAALPLTNNGKLDRRRLLQDAAAALAASSQREITLAATPTERAVAGIWSELLGPDRVGVDVNFFDLGGHSVLAIQVITRIREQLGVDVPLRVFFEEPTVRALAARVDGMRSATAEPQPIGETIARVERGRPLEVSFTQERLWFLQQLEPASTAYTIPAALRLKGLLQPALLEAAWNRLVERHESLRTRFAMDGDRVVQLIDEPTPMSISVVDIRHEPEGERGRRLETLLQAEVRRPFDLAAGPLLRPLLVRVGEREHVLLLAMHHVVGDQWSLGIIVRELATCYNALAKGRDATLPALTLQYADFAAWQRGVMQGSRWTALADYWRRRLETAPPLSLPTDHPRPATLGTSGAVVRRDLDAALLDTLRERAAGEGATLFMVLLAGFVTVLRRYTGQEDILVGSPVAGRHHAALERVVGAFINTLPLRVDATGDPTLRELVARVRQTTVEAFEHEDAPFDKLVAELRPSRDMSHAPIVQVLFNLLNAPVQEFAWNNLEWTPFDVDRGAAQLDISLSVDADLTRTVYAEFNTELFEASSVARMVDHWVRVLEQYATHPERRLSGVELLSSEEVIRQVAAWSDTIRPLPEFETMVDWFRGQARRQPSSVAVIATDGNATFGELDEKSDRLAAYLVSRGIGTGALVGVCLERSAWLPIVLLGVLKSGAAYVPLDPTFPEQRLAQMVEDSGLRLVLTQEGIADQFLDEGAETLSVDSQWEAISARDGRFEAPRVSRADRAYVIYTSGSTGRPKGVEVSHGSVLNLLASMQREPGLSADDVLLAVTTLSFDIAVLELYLPLVTGARVVIASRDEVADAHQLSTRMEQTGATVMQATPATWRMLIDAGWRGDGRLKALCGGEALTSELAAQLLTRTGSLWNMYGPTETTVWSTCERVTRSDAITIGRPIDNTRVYVVDGTGRLAPVGVPGELLIGGEGVAIGYLNRPELTAERFVPDSLTGQPGLRLYRTGDLARWRSDGRLECLGRLDHQVKVRGFRIELGEVESVLERHEAVRQAVASVHDDPSAGRRLVAYVSFHLGAEATASELRRFARQYLPEYMVPSLVTVLDDIPLTPNGKVNRRALPSPLGSSRGVRERIPPRTEMERLVAAIWKDVIGVDEVGIHDNFFDIGGHSLLSIQAIAKIERQVGVRLNPARFIMDNLEQIAAACEDMLAAAASPSADSRRGHTSGVGA